MKQFLVTLPRNLIGCFTGWRIIWHIIAILLTFILVMSGFDWRYFLATRNPALRSWMWPAVGIGGLLPLALPLLLFGLGVIARNARTILAGWAGGRRFWPVRCGTPIDLAGLQRDRDQLWAEALLRYLQKATWWLDDPQVIEDAVDQQRSRYQEDVWQERVVAYAIEEAQRSTSACPDGRGFVSIPAILNRLGVETPKQDQAAANRVARCLKAANWERFRRREGDVLEWRYRKVEPK